jgi:hypothetical protein
VLILDGRLEDRQSGGLRKGDAAGDGRVLRRGLIEAGRRCAVRLLLMLERRSVLRLLLLGWLTVLLLLRLAVLALLRLLTIGRLDVLRKGVVALGRRRAAVREGSVCSIGQLSDYRMPLS